jgi:hypothetical protein
MDTDGGCVLVAANVSSRLFISLPWTHVHSHDWQAAGGICLRMGNIQAPEKLQPQTSNTDSGLIAPGQISEIRNFGAARCFFIRVHPCPSVVKKNQKNEFGSSVCLLKVTVCRLPVGDTADTADKAVCATGNWPAGREN